MTLNQTWKNCLRMWKWIAKVWEPGMDVRDLKEKWLRKYKPLLFIQADCFFCQYDKDNDPDYIGNCAFCPGQLVNKRFHCGNTTYNYQDYPKKFYQKLLCLDTKRRAQ